MRDSYVYLQIYDQIHDQLKSDDKNCLLELRNHLDLKHKSEVFENKSLYETFIQLNRTTNLVYIEMTQSCIHSKMKELNKAKSKTFQKTRVLLNSLNFSSSSVDYHKARKWCRYYYYQEDIFNDSDFEKVSLEQKNKIHKLTEYLGNEHDLQLFYNYLSLNFTNASGQLQPYLFSKINRLRKKILTLYPDIFL
jgi:hypothetical protein